MSQPDDTLTLIVGGQRLTGWTSVRVSRSCEKMPSDFDISLTERNPDTTAQVDIQPGQPCQVMIGSDQVLSGYVDRRLASINAHEHTVRIQGRGKCEDLVDCSIIPDILNGMQITTSSLLDLATKVSAPFNITASSLTGDNVPVTAFNSGAPLVFNANLQETPFEVLEEVARYVGVLIYDGTDGNLLIANVGTSTMASGFSQGVNVQNAAVGITMDERFSEYLPVLMSTNFFGQQGIGGTQFPRVVDKGVPRFRSLFIISEQFQFGQAFAERRAQWEAARRWGRSQAVQITCDSWRDSAGTLWAPNAFASISLPALKLTPSDPWIIGHVDFIRDLDRGTVADLTLMPKEAFQPEPEILTQWYWDPSTTPPTASGGAVPGGAPT